MKDTIVLHHSADPSDKPQFEKVLHYHDSGAGGKWPKGRGIQYHWFVGKDGTVKYGQGEQFALWHAGNWAVNKRSIAVCLAGDLRYWDPTPAQVDALTELLTEIQRRWAIPDSRILLHREVRDEPTACPGMDIRKHYFARRQEKLAERIPQIERALARAKGPRRAMLQRLLDRLQKLPIPTRG